MAQDPTIQQIILMEDGEERAGHTHKLVGRLWNTLEHPQLAYVGPKYLYRQADGSNNSITNPEIGKAGSTYAKSIRTASAIPVEAPDPGLLFDLLMSRGKNFKANEAGFSGLFFCHAALITHDLFHTDRRDSSINNTSSYLDLSPLYGFNEEDQKLVRTFTDGEIKPDTFFDKRVLGLPPVISVMLVMYSRFHNHAARTLAAINEGGRFTLNPRLGVKEAKIQRDNDLFQVARLVTNGLYVNISVNDYVRAILNVNNSLSNWSLNPQAEIGRSGSNDLHVPRGLGNQVSCEFNLLYRFHSALSESDAEWTEEFFRSLLHEGEDLATIGLPDFHRRLQEYESKLSKYPWKRNFGGLQRGANGMFDDGELAGILKKTIEDPAGAFGANQVPDALRPIEIMGILQARKWHVASLNEFRRFLRRPTYNTFEELNPDPKVVEILKTLYTHPDNVEMYPGLLLERTRPVANPGSAIGAPLTVAEAVLADAVSLIRGDRHMTLDYSPSALTNWGISEVAPDPRTHGGTKIYHLIQTALPGQFDFNSIYIMQPFFTPKASAAIFERLEKENPGHGPVKSLFSFDQPSKPRKQILVTTYASVKRVLDDQTNFKVLYTESGFITTFMLSGDLPINTEQREMVGKVLHACGEGAAVRQFSDFAQLISHNILKTKAVRLGRSYHIDVVKDFGNLAALHFASVLCHLPLKFEFGTDGTYEEAELYGIFTKLIEFVLYNFEPVKTWALRRDLNSADGMPKLIAEIQKRVEALEVGVSPSTSHKSPFSRQGSNDENTESAIRTYGATFIQRLLSEGTGVKETTEILIGIGIGIVGSIGIMFSRIIDFYLEPENKAYWNDIIQLSIQGTTEADEKIAKYILEAERLSASINALVRRTEPADGEPIELVVDHKGTKVALNKGDRVVASLVHASRDPEAFPNPDLLDLDRPLDLYLNFGLGPHKCLGWKAGLACLVSMLKSVAVLKNLRRMPGEQGHLKIVNRPNGHRQYMTPNLSEFSVFPTTMRLLFDESPHQY